MYVRPQNYRYPPGVRLPENYGGSTFREPPPEDISEEEVAEPLDGEEPAEQNEEKPTEKSADEAHTASLLSPSGFKLRLGSLFGGNKGIGTEELLIIALILLLSDSDGNDDLILFLLLLFFIK